MPIWLEKHPFPPPLSPPYTHLCIPPTPLHLTSQDHFVNTKSHQLIALGQQVVNEAPNGCRIYQNNYVDFINIFGGFFHVQLSASLMIFWQTRSSTELERSRPRPASDLLSSTGDAEDE